MKKVLAVFLSVAMLFSLTACGKNSDDASASESAAPTEIQLTTTVNINDNGDVECRVVETYGYNDLKFTFNGKKLTKVESVLTVIGNDKLFQQVEKSLDEMRKYFSSVEFDEANQTINCVYSKDGMMACSFIGKTPDELKEYLETYASDNTIGLSPAQAGDVFGATPAP